MLPVETSQKLKTFWERPEGTTGKVFLVAIVAGAGVALYHFLPVLILLATNTLHLAFLIAAIGALLYMAMDKRVHNIISYGYQGVMRGITKMFVNIDPISIIETYIEGMKKSLVNMDVQRNKLRQEMRKLQNVIDTNEKERQNSLKLADAAKNQGAVEVLTVKTRKAGRLLTSNETLKSLYIKMEILYRALNKMYQNAGYVIEDVEGEIEVKKRERAALTAGQSAFRSASKIIHGDQDQKYMFDQAMEAMADDIGNKLGEMEHFMDMSKNFLDSVDLQSGVLQEDGLRQLEAWTHEKTSLLLGTDKTLLISQAKNSGERLDLDKTPSQAEDPSRKSNKHSDLWD